jgi:hypothetical protein
MNKVDFLIGLLILVAVTTVLFQRGLYSYIVWFYLAVLVTYHFPGVTGKSYIVAAIGGIFVLFMLTKVYGNVEGFENEEEDMHGKKDPNPAPPKTSDPHIDVGTTILHAYRNLTPEQIGGMRRDTKELLTLQKELMGSLSEMKPAIEQGAELLKTFSTFFGDQQNA